MSWVTEIAGSAEHVLNNYDQQTGVALRSNGMIKSRKSDEMDQMEPWNHRGRRSLSPQRLAKKSPPVAEPRSNYPPRKRVTTVARQQISAVPFRNKDDYLPNMPPTKQNTTAKKQLNHFNLNRCPQTMVESKEDVGEGRYKKSLHLTTGFSHPQLDNYDVIRDDALKLENLEVENAMLKNELNVMNREITDLLDKLRKTEKDLVCYKTKVENNDTVQNQSLVEKQKMKEDISQLQQQIDQLITVDIIKYKTEIKELESELTDLKITNKNLEDIINQLNQKTTETDANANKLEVDLQHAQSTIIALQGDIDKSKEETQRVEKDWEAYKNRVKSMLLAKDKEIRALREGIKLTEDTKLLVEQIENLKEERDNLTGGLMHIRGECQDMKRYMDTLNARHKAAARVVMALRDALNDERAARNRAEAQANALSKELKSLQIETGQIISSLRDELREKENELHNGQQSSGSSIHSSNESALNVADYDINRTSSSDHRRNVKPKIGLRQGATYVGTDICMTQETKVINTDSEAKKKSSSVIASINTRPPNQYHLIHMPQKISSKFSRKINELMTRTSVWKCLLFMYMMVLHFGVVAVLYQNAQTIHKFDQNYVPRYITE